MSSTIFGTNADWILPYLQLYTIIYNNYIHIYISDCITYIQLYTIIYYHSYIHNDILLNLFYKLHDFYGR